jgi:hypothetical protein
MTLEEIRERLTPAVEQIIDQCRIADEFVDKEKFQVMMATVWGNAVLDPGRSGIEESDLEDLHEFLNEFLSDIVGKGYTLTDCYRFIMSKKGDESLARQQVTGSHKDFLLYFARLILKDELVLPGS